MKDLEKKRARKQDQNVTKCAGNGNVMGMMATVVTHADILLCHFKMVHGTLGMLDAIVIFHDAANL